MGSPRYPKKDSEHLLGEVIQRVLDETRLTRPYLEHRSVELWKELVGPKIMRYVSKVELRGESLYVRVVSPLVRNELLLLKEDILVRMHKEIDERKLKRIIIS